MSLKWYYLQDKQCVVYRSRLGMITWPCMIRIHQGPVWLFTLTSIGITYMSIVQQWKEAKKCCYKRHWRYDKEYKINHSSNSFLWNVWLVYALRRITLLEESQLASLHVNRRPGNNICRKLCVTAGVNQIFCWPNYSMHQHQCLERASMKPLMPDTSAFCTCIFVRYFWRPNNTSSVTTLVKFPNNKSLN